MRFYQQLRYYPFIRLLLPFISGIIISLHIEINFLVLLSLLSFTFLALFIPEKFYKQFRFRWIFGSFLNIFLFVAGFLLASIHRHQLQSETCLSGREICFRAYIYDTPQEKERSVKAILRSIELSDSSFRRRPVKILAYFEKGSDTNAFKEGDILIINSVLSEIQGPQNPDEFNFKKLMFYRGTVLQTYISTGKWIKTGRKKNIRIFSAQLRDKILDIYKKNKIKGDELAVLAALILGYREEMPEEITQAYAVAGAMHVLSVSGLHVGIIYLLLNSLLKFIVRFRYGIIIKIIIVLSVLWTFAFIAGMKPSVVRAAFMFSVIQAGISFKKQSDIYNTIAVSAFFLLLVNPMQVTDIGFQLSYLAVLSIVFFQPRFYALFEFKNWLADKVWILLTVTFAAQIGTTPLSMYYFHQFPLFFWITNVFIIPLVTLIIYFGVLVLVVDLIRLPAIAIAKITVLVIRYTDICVGQVKKFPLALIENINLNKLELLFIYSVIILFSSYILLKKPRLLLVALSFLFLFLVHNTYKNFTCHQITKFIVFKAKGHSVIGLIDGKKALLLHSFPDPEDKRFQFVVKSCLIKNGVMNNTYHYRLASDSVAQACHPFWLKNEGDHLFFFMPGLKGILIRNRLPCQPHFHKKLNLDCIVLANNAPVSIEQLKRSFNFRMLILDSSNSYYYIKNWKNQSVLHKIPLYSVLDDNALEMNL